MWDQTDKNWLAGLDPEELGTGLYLFRAPVWNDPDAVQKKLDPDVTYDECKSRGDIKYARAIKWVPHKIASWVQVTSNACGSPCKDTCVEFGCICDEVKHECV